MGHPTYTADEVGDRAQEIYDRDIRARVEPDQNGRFLVLDIETGHYEIGDDYGVILRKMQAAKPNSALFAFRIGYPALGKMGGNWRNVNS